MITDVQIRSIIRIVSLILVLSLQSCEKADFKRLLKINTVSYSDLKTTAVKVSGEFIDFGSDDISEYGICWSVNNIPVITDWKVITGQQPTDYTFTQLITDLQQNQKYYVRAYATTKDTTVYGSELDFITLLIVIPSISTANITGITNTTASCGGNVTSDGNSEVLARGVCWGISSNPTIRDSKTINDTGIGVFTSELTGLLPNVTYYVRAYATNIAGTAYGEEKSFKTVINK